MPTLGIIGGGAMGSALLKGLLDKKLFKPEEIFVAEVDNKKRAQLKADYRIQVTDQPAELAADCEIIILAVKPNMVAGVLKDIASQVSGNLLVLSIAAGITLNFMENQLPTARFVRVMPNTPARIGQGVSAFALGSNATNNDEESTAAIFGCVGKVIKVPEYLLDAVTAVSGSGPAYVYYFIEALINAGVMAGLSRGDAAVLAMETFLGSTALLKETGAEPNQLKNEVTSPGGTTAAALFELEKGACAGTIMKAVAAAVQRAKELGAK